MTISSLMSPWYVNMGSQYKHTRASIQHPAPLLKIFILVNKLLTLLSLFRVQIYDRKWFRYFFSAFSLGQFFCLIIYQVFCLNLCSAENSSSPVIRKYIVLFESEDGASWWVIKDSEFRSSEQQWPHVAGIKNDKMTNWKWIITLRIWSSIVCILS